MDGGDEMRELDSNMHVYISSIYHAAYNKIKDRRWILFQTWLAGRLITSMHCIALHW
jgi:hypothetical protein